MPQLGAISKSANLRPTALGAMALATFALLSEARGRLEQLEQLEQLARSRECFRSAVPPHLAVDDFAFHTRSLLPPPWLAERA